MRFITLFALLITPFLALADETISNGLTLKIPSAGAVNWSTAFKNDFATPISGHDHTGGGKGLQLGSSSLSANALNGTNFRLQNNTALRSRNAANSGDLNLIKADASNVLRFENAGAGTRLDLGLAIGTNVQAYDEELADVAGLTPTDNNFIVGNGTAFVAESGATARTSLGAAASGSNSDITALTAVSTSNFAPTYSGGAATFDTAPTTQSATYTRLGKMILYYNRFAFEIAPGSSDTTSFTATLPLTATTAQDGSCWGSYDIDTIGTGPAAAILNSTTQVTILRDGSANWTKDKATTVWLGCLYTIP